MQALVIVIPHVAPEREAQLAVRREPRAMDHLGLQRMKERLHMRVVPRGPPARGALPDAQDPEAIAEPLGGILAAAITVEDEAGTWAPAADGRIEHRSGEVRVARAAEGPGEQPAGALVQHDRQDAPPPDDGRGRSLPPPGLMGRPALSGAGTGRARPPRVVARAGDPVERAEPRHGVRPPLRVDERERVSFRVAQNRMAFFKRACSSCSSAWARSSAWRRRISRAGGIFTAGARPPRSTPSRTAFRHRDSMNG